MPADHFSAEPIPSVSVVLPIRNEQRHISRTLAALVAQDYPADRLEILVADGQSTDSTRDIVRSFADQLSNLRIVDNPGRFVPTGLNRAISEARGEIIVRVDGHTLIAPDYVRQCVAALRRTGADNVGGPMTAVGAGRFAEAVAIATSSPFGVGGGRFHYSAEEEWVDTVYLGAWPRSVFARVGLFDEEQIRNQDDEFNYRLRQNGGRILLCPEIRSTYEPRRTAKSLWRQYFEYGYWKVRVLQKHPRQMQSRQFVPPAFVGALIGSAVAAPFGRFGRITLATVGGGYVAANLAASIWAARRQGWRHLPVLPVVFGILHLSYGTGFLFGLGRFIRRW
jgi:succinoglycan biosynthesis protein ExoA